MSQVNLPASFEPAPAVMEKPKKAVLTLADYQDNRIVKQYRKAYLRHIKRRAKMISR